MSLGDVDERELGAVTEALVEPLDVARPATKRRSGEAAEDEQQRPTAVELGHGDRLEVGGTSDGQCRKRLACSQRLGRAVGGEARDCNVALDARWHLLDVATVGRVDERGELRIAPVSGHPLKLRDTMRGIHSGT
jgi:hypothetical protein